MIDNLNRAVGCAAMAAGLAVLPAPAAAQQEDFEQIVTIMRACAAIEDVAARVTCYDNNIRPRGAVAAAAGAGSVAASPVAPRSAPPVAPAATGFGSEMLAPSREEQVNRDSGEDGITASVAAISPLEPGIYLVTLADGAQWRFVDSAPNSWSPPRPGDRVELERGALGSVFLKYDNQRRLRVRRVQ